jgi:hypothetical protein
MKDAAKGAPTMPASAAADAAHGGGTGQNKMENCPSSVPGAKTTVAEDKGAVKLTIVAPNAKATKTIRDNARHLVNVSKEAGRAPQPVTHDGKGHGGGGLGRCPVVLTDTTVTSKSIPGGAAITLKPKKAEELAVLKKTVEERLASLPATP